jgi:hypothetical protein
VRQPYEYLPAVSAHRSAKRRFVRFDAALHAAGPWCVAVGASHVDDTRPTDRTDSRNGTFVVKAFLLDAIDAMASERAPAELVLRESQASVRQLPALLGSL